MAPDTAPGNNEQRLADARLIFREAWFAGNPPDLDSFCQRHAECGPKLREKLEDFIYVMNNLPVADGLAEDAPPADKQETRPADEPLNITLGDYRLIREIGRGGMGVVYEAEQVSLKRRVALKVLPRHLSLSEERILKFRREAEAGGRQSHPGIVSIFAIGEFEGIHYIAQELVGKGRTLADKIVALKRRSQLPRGYFRNAAKVVVMVAEALKHAHDSGVIHRDVKPSNILIAGNGTPKVTDFGLAKIEGALALSRTGDFSGTPFYMSPEQAASRRMGIDHRTDIFSLGVTLYELITLTLPFKGETTPEVLKQILLHDPKDPHKINPRVPRDLSVICLKALEKKPEDRYQAMEALAADLQRFIAGDSIQAKPMGTLTRTMKKARRNPVVSVSVGAVILTIMITIMVVLFWMNPKVDEANRGKEQSDLEAYSQRLASQSTAQLPKNPGLALKLGVQAATVFSSFEANNVLIEALTLCRERMTIRTGRMEDCALHPTDDTVVVVAYSDGTFQFWNSLKGEALTPPIKVSESSWPLRCVGFSPDGKRLAVGSFDGTGTIWDISDLSKVSRIQVLGGAAGIHGDLEACHNDEITSIAFDRTGTRIVTASRDLSARVWDTLTGRMLTEIKGHAWTLTDAVISPDSRFIVTASEDGFARIWNAETGEDLGISLNHVSPVKSADFSPGGRRVLTASERCVFVWDALTGDLLATFDGHDGAVNQASFDAGGACIITASDDGTACVWDAESGEKKFTLIGHEGRVLSASFIAGKDGGQGRMAITASDDGTVRRWDVTPDNKHPGWIEPVVNPQGNRLAMISEDRRILRVWDRNTGNLSGDYCPNDLMVPEKDKTLTSGEIKKIIFSPDGDKLVAVMEDNFWWVWNISLDIPSKTTRTSGDIEQIAFSPDSRSLAMTSSKREVRVIDVEKMESEEPRTLDDVITSFAFDSTSRRIVAVLKSGKVQVMDAELKKVLFPLDVEEGMISRAEFDVEGGRILGVSDFGTAGLWNAGTGAYQGALLNTEWIKTAQFFPSGRRVLILPEYGAARLWDEEQREEIQSLSGYNGVVDYAVISPDNKKIVLSTNHDTIWVWDVDGERMHFKMRHGSRICFIGFSPESEWLWVGTDDGALETYPVNPLAEAKVRKPGELTREECILFNIPDDSGKTEDITVPSTRSREDPDLLSQRCWEIVRTGGRTIREYNYALSLAKAACRTDLSGLRILGAAEFRVGMYGEAQKIFKHLRSRRAAMNFEVDPLEVCLSAMAFYKSGNTDQAQNELNLYASGSNANAGEAGIREIEDLADEAKALITASNVEDSLGVHDEGKAGNPKHMPLIFTTQSRNKSGTHKLWAYDPESGKNSESESNCYELYDYGAMELSMGDISPKGEKLCFATKDGNRSLIKTQALQRTDGRIAAGERQIVFNSDSIRVSCCVWNPDSEKIYFRGEDGSNLGQAVYWIHSRGNPDQQPSLLLGRAGHSFAHLAISKEGTQIGFAYYPDKSNGFRQEIWIADLCGDGGSVQNPAQLTTNTASDDYPCFSSDSDFLYFISQGGPDGPYRLSRIDLSGRHIHTLFDTNSAADPKYSGMDNVVVSPDGQVAFSLGDRYDGLYEIKMFSSAGVETRIVRHEEWRNCRPVGFLSFSDSF
ncbi:MAG: protein kinase [Planctomycetota bacterium]